MPFEFFVLASERVPVGKKRGGNPEKCGKEAEFDAEHDGEIGFEISGSVRA